MNAQEIGKRVAEIAIQAKATFIDREDVIDALATAFCSGEHVIILGPPGTAKSALVIFFAKAMQMRSFRRVLNPDINRWDITGPLDPIALKEGRWENKWAGLATADFAFLDEIGKASGQVQNILLDALEERKVASGDVDQDIPLHMAVAASNETLDESVEAVWDRFTVRLVVNGLDNTGDFVRMLTESGAQPVVIPISRDEAACLRSDAVDMSKRLSAAVLQKAAEMWSEHKETFGARISERRWIKTMRLAAGRAILHGRTEIAVEDLVVGRWTLWNDLDERESVGAWVEEKAFADVAELRDVDALVHALEEQVRLWMVNPSTLEDAGKSLFRTRKLQQAVKDKDAYDPRWTAIKDRLTAVQFGLEGISEFA